MRRGKSTGTPTKDEACWMAAIKEFGCVVCHLQGRGYVPAAVHHILSGGIRLGHLFTIPLCDPGHHQHAPKGSGEVSRHPDRVEFEQRYGTEMELFFKVNDFLFGLKNPVAKMPDSKVVPRPMSVCSITNKLAHSAQSKEEF